MVIPCHNEEENIAECIRHVPSMGRFTEVVVVDDGSSDKTGYHRCRNAQRDSRVTLITYKDNRGKGNAVQAGFSRAKGDVIMILDADMTVAPEELPLFFEPIAKGIADFTNGTRLIYPMQDQAMRFLNLVGNFFFGMTLSWLMRQRISDTLCGTKCMRKSDYLKIPMGQDPWGDFDLLFGAAENNLRIVEIPVHYRARTGGLSKMKPFKHAMILAVRCWQGFLRLKLGIKRR